MKSLFLCLLLSIQLFASTLHLATSTNPSRLNPLLATDSSSSEIANFIFNGLVKYDKDNAKIIGDLATSYYFENDTTLIFELRDDVKWHDEKDLVQKMLFLHLKLYSPILYLRPTVQILDLSKK